MAGKPEHTNAFKLFHYPFRAFFANMYKFSEVEQREVGVFSTGTEAGDIQWANQETLQSTTLNKLAEIFAQGGSFTFEDPQDSVKAYDIITGHLSDLVRVAGERVNWRPPPPEDIRLLDEFAGEIYRSARVHMVASAELPELVKVLLSLNPMADVKEATQKTVPETHQHPIAQMMAGTHDVMAAKEWEG